jgi:hypothetical protein
MFEQPINTVLNRHCCLRPSDYIILVDYKSEIGKVHKCQNSDIVYSLTCNYFLTFIGTQWRLSTVFIGCSNMTFLSVPFIQDPRGAH